jgi:hypothetical protein
LMIVALLRASVVSTKSRLLSSSVRAAPCAQKMDSARLQ